jgi:hypothetical protein
MSPTIIEADGESWMGVPGHQLWCRLEVSMERISGSGKERERRVDHWAFGPTWGKSSEAYGSSTGRQSGMADLGRTMRTADGGATWAAVYSRKVNVTGWTSLGLDVTTSYGIHFDPFDQSASSLPTPISDSFAARTAASRGPVQRPGAQGLDEHDLLGCLRPQSTWPDVER